MDGKTRSEEGIGSSKEEGGSANNGLTSRWAR